MPSCHCLVVLMQQRGWQASVGLHHDLVLCVVSILQRRSSVPFVHERLLRPVVVWAHDHQLRRCLAFAVSWLSTFNHCFKCNHRVLLQMRFSDCLGLALM